MRLVTEQQQGFGGIYGTEAVRGVELEGADDALRFVQALGLQAIPAEQDINLLFKPQIGTGESSGVIAHKVQTRLLEDLRYFTEKVEDEDKVEGAEGEGEAKVGVEVEDKVQLIVRSLGPKMGEVLRRAVEAAKDTRFQEVFPAQEFDLPFYMRLGQGALDLYEEKPFIEKDTGLYGRTRDDQFENTSNDSGFIDGHRQKPVLGEPKRLHLDPELEATLERLRVEGLADRLGSTPPEGLGGDSIIRPFENPELNKDINPDPADGPLGRWLRERGVVVDPVADEGRIAPERAFDVPRDLGADKPFIERPLPLPKPIVRKEPEELGIRDLGIADHAETAHDEIDSGDFIFPVPETVDPILAEWFRTHRDSFGLKSLEDDRRDPGENTEPPYS